ncbi:UNVERIFIED_CONTAM: glycoside hydrolase family 31 protein, partial [Prevotella sp. 15_C9]
FMDFPQDKKVYDMADEYMFGRALLVAPVTEPMYVDKDKSVNLERVKTKPVYLPAGCSWFDFWTGEQFSGQQTINREVPIDIMPLYVRAG